MTMRGSDMLSGTLLPIFIDLREIRKHSSSNECMSLSYMVTFPRLIWCPKPKLFFCLKSESSFGRKDTVLIIRRPVLCLRYLCNPSDTSKGEYETQKQRLIHVLTTHHHNSQTDLLVTQTGYFA